MTDRVVVITGGSRGIGRATAIAAAARGFGVVIGYATNKTAADEVLAKIEASNGKAIAVKGDVGSEADILAIFEAADALGPARCLRQQCRHRRRQGARRRDERGTARAHDAHQCGRFHPVRPRSGQAHVDASRRQGWTIVNISSAAAVLGAPDNYVDYAASKGAIERSPSGSPARWRWKDIRVKAVRPGIIDTDIHASGGQPDRALIQDTAADEKSRHRR